MYDLKNDVNCNSESAHTCLLIYIYIYINSRKHCKVEIIVFLKVLFLSIFYKTAFNNIIRYSIRVERLIMYLWSNASVSFVSISNLSKEIIRKGLEPTS